jgi:hypothetical protein
MAPVSSFAAAMPFRFATALQTWWTVAAALSLEALTSTATSPLGQQSWVVQR